MVAVLVSEGFLYGDDDGLRGVFILNDGPQFSQIVLARPTKASQFINRKACIIQSSESVRPKATQDALAAPVGHVSL